MATVDASQYAYAMSALDKLLADLKARVGKFLANQKTIMDATDMAKAVQSATTGAAKDSASVLVSKGSALLKVQADSEAQATTMLTKAGELKGKVSTPLYSFLQTSPLTWGWRQGELLVGLLNDVAGMSRDAANLATRIAKQNGDVSTFVKEVSQVQQAAAGTGYLPKISSFIGSTVGAAAGGASKALWPLAIVAGVGGLVYLTAPQLLKGFAGRK